jgi:hypothetical protein
MTKRSILLAAIAFFAGVVAGGYLFAQSQPRSFLALKNCAASACYQPNDLAGLLVSAGIQRTPGLIPKVLKETDKCVAIEHPFSASGFHAVIFPKKDIKNIADISAEDAPYMIDCFGVIRALIVERGLRYYRVHTNGPGYQDVTYLHFHLISK